MVGREYHRFEVSRRRSHEVDHGVKHRRILARVSSQSRPYSPVNKGTMVSRLQDRKGVIFRAHQRQDIDDLLDGVGDDEVFHMPLYSLPQSTEFCEDF